MSSDNQAGARKVRPLSAVARDILDHWQKPYFGAVPYIRAMFSLNSINDMYGADSAESIVQYFLTNCASWRGPDARRVKAELREMLKGVKSS